MWPFSRRERRGAICPSCGSRNTHLYVNKTNLSWYRVGRNTVNMEVPGLKDIWRCRDCNSTFDIK
jgi:hypothetical protein